MLSLHLLQTCIVFVDTLMLQHALARPHWIDQLTPRDQQAITPLIWDHVNPYGRYELDMDSRTPVVAGDTTVGNGLDWTRCRHRFMIVHTKLFPNGRGFVSLSPRAAALARWTRSKVERQPA
jgi:hypothetical protein